MRSVLALAVALSVLGIGVAHAKNEGTLPKGAVRMTSQQVAEVFAGRTVIFTGASYYFDRKGNVVGISPKKDGFAVGKWGVKDNEFCFVVDWRGADKSQKPFHFRWCNQLWLANDVVWSKETAGEERYRGNIYTGLTDRLHPGDSIGAQVRAVSKKWGY